MRADEKLKHTCDVARPYVIGMSFVNCVFKIYCQRTISSFSLPHLVPGRTRQQHSVHIPAAQELLKHLVK